MKSLAAVAPRRSAETTRQALDRAGVLRRDLRVASDGSWVVFAVHGPVPLDVPGVRFEEREFEELPTAGPRSYWEAVDVPADVRARLPRSFDVVGDIVLVRLPDDLRAYGPRVGAALLEFVPGARLVGADEGVEGEARIRRRVRLAGTGPWTTEHRENGLRLAVDLERAYFSPRLGREHALVAESVRSGERVLDFACGVAPFGAHILRDGRAREVVAADSNPAATELAERNLARVARGTPYRVVTASIEEFAPSAGVCERAILNLPHTGFKYLPSVAAVVGRGGAVHYYERTARSALAERPGELVNAVGSSSEGRWTVAEVHVVHPYSPSEDIVAYRLERA